MVYLWLRVFTLRVDYGVNDINLHLSAVFTVATTELFKCAYAVGINMLVRNPKSLGLFHQILSFESASFGVLRGNSMKSFWCIQSTTCNRHIKGEKQRGGWLAQSIGHATLDLEFKPYLRHRAYLKKSGSGGAGIRDWWVNMSHSRVNTQ